jgi:hypothetical protein
MRLMGAGAIEGRTYHRQLQRFLFLCVRASRIIALSLFSRRLRRRLISRCRSEAIVNFISPVEVASRRHIWTTPNARSPSLFRVS